MKAKIQIVQTIKLEANLPAGSKILTQTDDWVTWYKLDKNTVEISTCKIGDFECQNDTKTIELFLYEVTDLAKVIERERKKIK
jgi:hypothetical protein